MFSSLKLTSIFFYELIFMNGVREVSRLIHLQMNIQLSLKHSLMRPSFSLWVSLTFWSNNNWPCLCGCISGLSIGQLISVLLIIIVLYYRLESGSVMTPTLFCLKISLFLVCDSMSILEKLILSLWKKIPWNFDMDWIKSIDGFPGS